MSLPMDSPSSGASQDRAGVDAAGLVNAVAQLARTATEEFSPEDLLRALCEVAASTMPVDGAGVMITEGGRVRYVHGDSATIREIEQLQDMLQEGPCTSALHEQRPVVVGDLASDGSWPRWTPPVTDLGWRGVAALPVVARGQTWGLLDLYRRAPREWTEPELAAARILADVAASYLVMAVDRDHARTAEALLAHRATHDDLTGLPNRALLLDRLEHALAAAQRRKAAVAVLFLDLNSFKAVNDDHGHHAGDSVLVEVARRLERVVRAEDTVARLAGDEFVVLCEDMTGNEAALESYVESLVSRLQDAVREPVAVRPGRTVSVDVSIGVALSTTVGTDPEALMRAADRRMYQSKPATPPRAGTRAEGQPPRPSLAD
jgi:diguanylate cyclase (GGDEF)-like protein